MHLSLHRGTLLVYADTTAFLLVAAGSSCAGRQEGGGGGLRLGQGQA